MSGDLPTPPPAPLMPTLQMTGLSTANPAAPPTPHKNSGRRLSKSVMTADSSDSDGSKGWGLVPLPMNDGSGTARAVRVVQSTQIEDLNMISVKWVFNLPDHTGKEHMQQVELRHGRRSGIRKIYVNKELVARDKSIWKAISDSGSTHQFMIGPTNRNECAVTIYPKGSIMSGYQYQLEIDGRAIEKQTAVGQEPTVEGLDIGVRAIELPKSANGLGMTIRNNPLGPTGVVVWTVEPGKPADQIGIKIGDVILSIEDHLVNEIDKLAEYVGESQDVVHMEIAGTATSRVVIMQKMLPGADPEARTPIGLGLQTTSCGVGILITEIDHGSAAAYSDLKIGDAVLSINDQVPSSPKDAVKLILEDKGQPVKFVIISSKEV